MHRQNTNNESHLGKTSGNPVTILLQTWRNRRKVATQESQVVHATDRARRDLVRGSFHLPAAEHVWNSGLEERYSIVSEPSV